MSPERRQFLQSTIVLAITGLAGCSSNGGDSSSSGSATGPDSGASASAGSGSGSGAGTGTGTGSTTGARSFVHPGLLHTDDDFARMKAKVAAGVQPWLDGWNALTSNGRAQLGATPRPLAIVLRGSTNNSAQMYIDIDRTYQLALRWKVTGDSAYADLAVVFLNAWSSTLTTLDGDADRFLSAGIYGFQWANAAEIMRGYPGWAAADVAAFQKMMLTIFYPMSHDFLIHHNGSEITNYWANWDLCNMACILATGVLCDRQDIYDEAVAYFKYGQGNGSALQAIYHVHPGNLGQWQESGRDQGHCTLGIGLLGAFCEMAWNQGDDLYGHENNRFLAGAEYVAKSNLKDAAGAFYAVPWFDQNGRQGLRTALSTGGQGSVRPVWESIYNHYVKRRGLAAPYVALQVAQLHPEMDGGNGDQLGFGTLTFSRDPVVTGNSPSGVTAYLQGAQVLLSWWGVAGATSYNVKRATNASGPFTTIATGVTDVLTWTDTTVAPSTTYYYTITATGSAGESAPSNAFRVATAPELLLHVAFDEGSGTIAADAVGNWPASTLLNGATWTTGRAGNAVAVDGVDDHVALPSGTTAALSDFTIAARVRIDAAGKWARVFDLGSGERRWMMLTIKDGSGLPAYAIDTCHGYVTQRVEGASALPVGQWVHVAVTLSGSTCTLYVDGVAVASNAAMTLAPHHLGATTSSFLGRSQYAADAFLQGAVDDYRLYSGALAAPQVAALV